MNYMEKCDSLFKSLGAAFFLHSNVGHTMNLSELLAVQRSQQFPRPRQRGDEVLSKRHGGMAANISEGMTGNDSSSHKREQQTVKKNTELDINAQFSPHP